MRGPKVLSLAQNQPRQAFTLIEILIVIAIVGILAAILFPVFGRTRENARRTTCNSNLKQIALGIQQYLQDYDERFPLDGTTAQEGWALAIQPYVKNEQLLQCPSEANMTPDGSTQAARANTPGFTDFYFNYNLGAGFHQSQLSFPANTILNGDGSGFDWPLSGANYSRSRLPLFDEMGPTRHLQGAIMPSPTVMSSG